MIVCRVVLDTTKVQIFKQITTGVQQSSVVFLLFQIPQRYRFSSKSQLVPIYQIKRNVVLDTTKVQIFKQITTLKRITTYREQLFQIPQRYRFSSKSQLILISYIYLLSCFRYHKGTDFQANHNKYPHLSYFNRLFQIPQRYRFSSKSQPIQNARTDTTSCFRYHKGTDFQANHNVKMSLMQCSVVVLDTTKVQIFKQITTIIQLIN